MLNPRNWFDDGIPLTDNHGVHDRILENFPKHVTADANGLSTAITLSRHRPRSEQGGAHRQWAGRRLSRRPGRCDKRNAASSTSTGSNQRISRSAQQLQQQQAAVATYKAEHGLNDTAPGTSLVDQQMAGINAQIVHARSELAEKQADSDRVAAV